MDPMPSPRTERLNGLAIAVVIVIATVAAWAAYSEFLEASRLLWSGGGHDRCAHYLFALQIATCLRTGDLFHLVDEVAKNCVWPPLHALVAGGLLVVGGPDYRLAVLPSLVGWIVTAVAAFLVARRAAPVAGLLAGAVAVAFVLASPCHRSYATEIMLESLGGGLSLVALWCYLRAVQDRTVAASRTLAIVLALMFLYKYNYWLLVVFAIVADDLLSHGFQRIGQLRHLLATLPIRAATVTVLRHPLTWLFAALVGVIVAVSVHGDKGITILGRTINVYPPHNLIHLAYVVCFAGLVLCWRRGGGAWVKTWNPLLQPFVAWLAWPIAVYMLLPKRPSNFVWFLSTANHHQTDPGPFSEGVAFYSRVFIDHFHAAPWGAVLAVALFLLALLTASRLKAGGKAVVLFVLISAMLTAYHPNRQPRYMHSWVAATWVVAGLGVVVLWPRRRESFAYWPRAALATVAAVSVVAVQVPDILSPAPAPGGGPNYRHPSFLDLTDYCLDDLDHSSRFGMLTVVPMKPFLQGVVLERYGGLSRLEQRWYGWGQRGESNRSGFREWLNKTECDTLVLFDRPGGVHPQELNVECKLHGEVTDLLAEQERFKEVKRQAFPELECVVTVWKRD